MPAAQRGAFSWGWPFTGGTRRLTHALLLDLTGRNAPLESAKIPKFCAARVGFLTTTCPDSGAPPLEHDGRPYDGVRG
jgi:hypothetical protein